MQMVMCRVGIPSGNCGPGVGDEDGHLRQQKNSDHETQ